MDYATGIAVDFVGNAYITGYTASYDFLSLRAVQSGNAGPYDAFLTKLNAAGTGLVWSTYLGGSASDAGYAVAVDSLSNAYVAGLSQSSNFPLHAPESQWRLLWRLRFQSVLRLGGRRLF